MGPGEERRELSTKTWRLDLVVCRWRVSLPVWQLQGKCEGMRARWEVTRGSEGFKCPV